MKKVCILIMLLCLSYSAFSQELSIADVLRNSANPEEMPKLSTKDAVSQTDSTVYIRDTVYSRRQINDSLTLLYVGGKYPNHLLTILIKGKSLNERFRWMKIGLGYFTGKIIKYQGKPAMVITDGYQMGIRIMI